MLQTSDFIDKAFNITVVLPLLNSNHKYLETILFIYSKYKIIFYAMRLSLSAHRSYLTKQQQNAYHPPSSQRNLDKCDYV